jgi:Rieske 2Fe-2S family protein
MEPANVVQGATFRRTTETFRPGARTLAQRYFVAPEVFAEEREKIFGRHWTCVGHQSQFARPGDYMVREIAGESVIVVRDQKGTGRAFYNVCRHRGTRLCQETSGHAAAIQCPYHAWTYALDGRLIGAPHMDGVPDFDKTDYG